MRILSNDDDRSLQSATLYLNPEEMAQLKDFLEHLLADPSIHHVHVNDEVSTKEVTVAILTDTNLNEFGPRSQKLILEDK